MSATASQTPATPLPVATTVAAVSTTTTTTVSKGYKTCHEVPPLSDDGSDYAQWNFCTQLILESRGLWNVVTGVTPKPNQVVDPTGYEEWCQKDRDAKIQITLSLKKGPFNIIASATTTRDCWNKLANRFHGVGEQRIAYLMEELFHGTLSETEGLEPQINKLLQAARNLDSLEIALADNVLAFVIIMSLPESMSTLKTILYNTRKGNLTYNGVVHQILNDEQCRIHTSGLTTTAFFAKAAKHGQLKLKSDKAPKHCSHCDICGHDVSECRKLKRQQENKTPTPPKKAKALPSSANVANANSDATSDDSDGETIHILRVAIASDPDNHIMVSSNTALKVDNWLDKWIVDSGASRTMCSHRDWFHSFVPFIKPTQVVLGDNSSIPAISSGHVHIRVPAGMKWNKLILYEVVYVPKLHGNLLSVPQLIRHGTKVKFSKESFGIFSSSGTLIGEGAMQGNLFTITAHVVHPATACIATINEFPCKGSTPPHSALSVRTSSMANLSTWHCRLGHLANDSVIRMVRHSLVKGMEIEGGHTPSQPCEPCLKGKQTHTEIEKTTDTRAQTTLG